MKQDEQRKQILEVLDYWKLVEFLGQVDVEEEPAENKAKVEKVLKRKPYTFTKVNRFQDIMSPTLSLETMLSETALEEFPIQGGELSFSFGLIQRNKFVDYLKKYLQDYPDLPEIPYKPTQNFAWFSFQTDMKGIYINQSFQLSPLLWAAQRWEQRNTETSFDLNIEMFETLLEQFDTMLHEKNQTEFLPSLYQNIQNLYVTPLFPMEEHNNLLSTGLISKRIGYFTYSLFKNEESKMNDFVFSSPTDLGRSFYLSDLQLLRNKIATGAFGSHSVYESKVLAYILSPFQQEKGMGDLERVSISEKENWSDMAQFFSSVLQVGKAPLGKWPSKFMPVLMQQVAVNLAIKPDSPHPIFSVNGPPGTGKTTLLKEVVANHIVERAILLSNYDTNPDDAFQRRQFKQGPLSNHAYSAYSPAYFALKDDRINNYGMLVASCNNAAVENITVDLPKGEDILMNLESNSSDGTAVTEGLAQVSSLFDTSQSDDVETVKVNNEDTEFKDIYFSRYADALLGTDENWGLISAPLGKRSNIKNYVFNVLNPMLFQYPSNNHREEHRLKYIQVRKKFLAQLNLVRQLQSDLDTLRKKENVSRWKDYSQDDLEMSPISKSWLTKYFTPEDSTKAQVTNPWFTPQYNREREKLFYYACKLHKEFLLSSKFFRQNVNNLLIGWNAHSSCKEHFQEKDREEAMPVLLQSLFLLTPVISTTFASAQNFMRDVKTSGVFGTLIVDESGQAQPLEAIGSLYRCRSAIVVGDPKQIEPVVSAETDMIKQLMTSTLLTPYKDKSLSVQGCADYLNPYGTFLGEEEEAQWVGCPLTVHRRCIDPMYSISNQLSYDGTMKQQTTAPKQEAESGFILEHSCWIDVKGSETPIANNHFVPSQGDVVLKLLQSKFMKTPTDELPKLYIITPFKSVKEGMVEMLKESILYETDPRLGEWMSHTSIGTVHTFQGQGTDEVIFLLGCDSTTLSSANWVNKNIVNVAATRAKFRFYMVGDQDVWSCKPVQKAREVTETLITAEKLNELLQLPAIPVPMAGQQVIEALSSPQEPISPPSKENDLGEHGLGRCRACNSSLIEKKGPHGLFIACPSFPKCKEKQKQNR